MREFVYHGKLVHLRTCSVRLPNGYTTTIEKIVHPGAALVVPFLSSHAIIMLRQYRPAMRRYFYELPAGTRGRDEAALACARREIREETGYRAGRLKRLGTIYPVPGYSTEKITIYRAERLIRSTVAHDADEVIESRVMKRTEVRRLFRTGKITDAKTICALTMCGWL